MDNITGGEGRVDNVPDSDKKEVTIAGKDYGRGYNTENTMKTLERNKAMYTFDLGAETAGGAMREPEMVYPGPTPLG
jgi:hypothetical protein